MRNPSPVELFAILNADFQSIAEHINTGTENPDTSRALVVFNLTPQPMSGIVVFRASMSWPRDMPLPPVVITGSEGGPAASAIREMCEGPDAKGRADRTQLSFAIYFAVTDVPANGWRTYIASYAAAMPAASPLSKPPLPKKTQSTFLCNPAAKKQRNGNISGRNFD